MNKPSWADAPTWARYLARDDDGAWWWFEDKPKPQDDGDGGYWGNRSARATVTRYPAQSWRTTLEERPQ